MTQPNRYLTKSRFKLAFECPTKLYYTKNNDYQDQGNDDPFMQALAKGGYQVGELAKYKYCADPIGEKITIDTLNEEEALQRTQLMLQQENVVIAEAAFLFENLFVRADILVKTKNHIKLIEVKSKSYTYEKFYSSTTGEPKSEWLPYLYDLAFQTYVVKNALKYQNLKITPYLLLANKEAVAETNGLNQVFKFKKSGNKQQTIIADFGTITPTMLFNSNLLKEINLEKEIDKLFNYEVKSKNVPQNHKHFEEFINWCSNIYQNQERVWTTPSNLCKSCQFKSDGSTDKKCGFSECWSNHEWDLTGKTNISPLNDNLFTELWLGNGGSSFSKKLFENNRPFLKDITEDVFTPKSDKNDSKYLGMTPFERRKYQIQKLQSKDYIFWKTEFEEIKEREWEYPYHMIDFETSTVALPYFEGMHPYETIAFQFSHHVIYENGTVEHRNQWISWEQNQYPNINFLNALMDSLANTTGTIFRYATHENSVLNKLREDLEIVNPPNKAELLKFINDITYVKVGKDGKIKGERCMVDLAEVVRAFYYSPHAKGSNSIKKILPAIIHDCPELLNRYSDPNLYGNGKKYSSLNFEGHLWLDPEKNNDPYKTLPAIFSDSFIEMYGKNEDLDDFEDVADGSAAMIAYNQLQFSELTPETRLAYKDALLRYCELDTLAMVMIIQGFEYLHENK